MDNCKIAVIIGLGLLIVGLCVMIKRSSCKSVEFFEEPAPSEPVESKLGKVPVCPEDSVRGDLAGPMPAEAFGAQPKQILDDASDPVLGNSSPSSCFPKAHLNPTDLLPSSEATEWSHANPAGKGGLEDQNFLSAGFHVGVNTVGQSLRNANMQIRSEPPNPQKKVGPWMQSTIEPDLSRRALEINSTDC